MTLRGSYKLRVKSLFEKQEPLYSSITCSTEPIEALEKDVRVICSRSYQISDKTADKYMFKFNRAIDAQGGNNQIDFEFDKTYLNVTFDMQSDRVKFNFMAESNEKYLYDYDWTTPKEE